MNGFCLKSPSKMVCELCEDEQGDSKTLSEIVMIKGVCNKLEIRGYHWFFTEI